MVTLVESAESPIELNQLLIIVAAFSVGDFSRHVRVDPVAISLQAALQLPNIDQAASESDTDCLPLRASPFTCHLSPFPAAIGFWPFAKHRLWGEFLAAVSVPRLACGAFGHSFTLLEHLVMLSG
jgi:hypothetical protein